MAMEKAMDKVQKYNIFCQVNDSLNTQNRQFTRLVHNLLSNSPILIYYKRNNG